MENEKWVCECGFETDTAYCPNCGKDKNGNLPEEEPVENVIPAEENEDVASEEITEGTAPEEEQAEEATEEVSEEVTEESREEIAEEVPTEEVKPEEEKPQPEQNDISVDVEEPVFGKKLYTAAEVRSLKRQIIELRNQLAAYKAENERPEDIRKNKKIKQINRHYSKMIQGKWPVLVMAILLIAISILTVSNLIISFSWLNLLATALLLPVELIGVVGLIKIFATGMSNREDIDFEKVPETLIRSINVLMVYTFIAMGIGLLGILVLLLSVGGYLGKFGEDLLERLPFIINLDFGAAVLIIAVIAAVFVYVWLLFRLVKKMLRHMANRAEKGKEVFFNGNIVAIFSFLTSFIVFISAYIVRGAQSTIIGLAESITKKLDISMFINDASFVMMIAFGAVFAFAGIWALYYNKIQNQIEEEIDSLE